MSSILVSGVLVNPFNRPLPNAIITLTSISNSFTVLTGANVTSRTNEAGEYEFHLQPGNYAVYVAKDSYRDFYGAITTTATTPPTTLNVLLKQNAMEAELPPDLVEFFQQVQNQVVVVGNGADEAARIATEKAAQAAASEKSSGEYKEVAGQAASSAGMSAATAEEIASKLGDLEQLIRDAGGIPVDSFEQGYTLTSIGQALRLESTGVFYSWRGTYPKEVPVGSTPETTGGISQTAWVDVNDLTLRGQAAAADGQKVIGRCRDIATLRSIQPTFVGQKIDVIEHTIGKGVGGGFFVCTALSGGASEHDDNGYRIVSNGAIWDRQDPGNIYLDRFGVIGGDYIDDAIVNALKAARRLVESDIWIPAQASAYKMLGGVVDIDLTDGNPIFVKGMSGGHTRVKIAHEGNNICFKFSKNFAKQRQFWANCGIDSVNISGVNSSGNGVNLGDEACAIRISDAWKGIVKNIFINGYSAGVGINLYNETAWTEGAVIEDVMIRSVKTGILFSRNSSPNTSNTSTNSFFKTTINNYSFNAGVGGVSNTAIKMGDGLAQCMIYGSSIDLTMWMSAGSWHNGVLVDNQASFVESNLTLRSDGYGINKDSTVEVVHLLRVMTGGICRPNVYNISGQNNPFPISKMRLIRNSCFYLDVNDGAALGYQGLPIMNPRGLEMRFHQEFSIAEQIAGTQYILNALPAGMRMSAVLRYWSVDDTPYVKKYEIQVLGGNFQTKVIPDLPERLNTAKVTTTTISNVQVLSGITLSRPSNTFHEGQSTTGPYLANRDENNNAGFSSGAGRQFIFVLPANTAAESILRCSLEMTVL